jgi:hypothetical protein
MELARTRRESGHVDYFVKVLCITLDMPVLPIDFDHVTELEFDVFEGLIAQCTATH